MKSNTHRQQCASLLHWNLTIPPSLWPDLELRKYHCPCLALTPPPVAIRHLKGNAKAEKDIEELVSEVTDMFAGVELNEDAIEGAYKALTDAYWIAKENNQKDAPKTRRKKSDQ